MGYCLFIWAEEMEHWQRRSLFAVDAIVGNEGLFVLDFGHFNAGPSLDIIAPAGSGFARILNTGFSTWPALSSLPEAPAP